MYYLFALSSSDGSRFFINGREIINNDGLHGNDLYKSYVVPLQIGFYPIRFEYFQGDGDRQFNFICLAPNQHETINLKFSMMLFK
ncbi:MAG: PA14 domain-containing protein [Bacteroidota bacterium]